MTRYEPSPVCRPSENPIGATAEQLGQRMPEIKPYTCSVCQERFRSVAGRDLHKKEKHRSSSGA